MTIQIRDIYRYNEQQYTCIGRNADIFNPCDFGLQPSCICTACWQGYWCEYEIKDSKLILQTLHIHDAKNHYPTINGINISPWEYIPALALTNEGLVPTEIPLYSGHESYEHLEQPLPFTGNIMLGIDTFERRKMKSLPNSKRILNFEFDNGKMRRVNDFSEIAQIIPKVYKKFGVKENIDEADIYERFPNNYREALWWYKETVCTSQREQKFLRDFLLYLN